MWDFPLFPEQASTTAPRVDAVFFYACGLLVFFTTMLCFLILFLAIRYRSGEKFVRKAPILHSTLLESIWIVVPLILTMILFGLGANVYFEIYSPAGGRLHRVDVVGKQWMWYLQHPEGRKEINELHVPIGRPVKLSMTSQDVIHSFYVPAFRVKRDVLASAGRPSSGSSRRSWAATTSSALEYCGTKHSAMGGWVVVMEPSEYQEWLKGGSAQPSIEVTGRTLFEKYHCSGCHGAYSEFQAPKLEGVYGGQVPILNADGQGAHFVTADDRYIRDSILLPKSEVVAGFKPIMPSFQGQIPEEDLIQLMAYIRSIGRKEAGR